MSFWTFLKSIKGKQSEMSHLIDDNRTIVDDLGKAELLNRVFVSRV